MGLMLRFDDTIYVVVARKVLCLVLFPSFITLIVKIGYNDVLELLRGERGRRRPANFSAHLPILRL